MLDTRSQSVGNASVAMHAPAPRNDERDLPAARRRRRCRRSPDRLRRRARSIRSAAVDCDARRADDV